MLRLPGVHPKHGSYYLVKKNKWDYLCRIEEGDQVLLREYSKRVEGKPNRLDLIFPQYLAEAEIAPDTRREYERILLRGQIGHRFGHMHPDDVSDGDIAAFLEDRKKAGAPAGANRERAALSSVYEFARRKRWAKTNPCRGVRRNRERPSRVYVKDDKLYDTQERASEALEILIDAGYYGGMRFTDLRKFRREWLVWKDGKPVRAEWAESKTGLENVMEFGLVMQDIILRAIAHGDAIATKITKKLPKPRALPEMVFVNTYGRPWSQWAMSSAMRRAKADFAFRQLRSKAETDSDHSVIGHKGQMLKTYVRKRKLRSVA
jgi:ribulose bisphosphate carboxylase small subunit